MNTIMWPAKHQSVICVGACNSMGRKMDMSAEGPEIDFLCPGEKVDSTGIPVFCLFICKEINLLNQKNQGTYYVKNMFHILLIFAHKQM